jgi:hypothetical protein
LLDCIECSEGAGVASGVVLVGGSCVISAGVKIEARGVAEAFSAYIAFCSA